MHNQQQFDFSEAGRRKQMLREVRLPRREKAVLFVIVSHGGDRPLSDSARCGCIASQATIAAETGYARSSVSAAVGQLLAAGILAAERIGRGYGEGVGLDLRVCWSNLEALWERQRMEETGSAANSLSNSLSDSLSNGWTQRVFKPEKKIPPSTCAPKAQQEAGSVAVLSPPLPSSPAPPLVSLLTARGVDQASTAVSRALGRGVDPAEIAQVCAWFDAADRSGWRSPAGLLYRKLCAMLPGEPPERGFPAVDQGAEERAAAIQRRVESTAEQSRQIARQTADDRQRDAAQESRFGPLVDALGDDQRAELLAAAPQFVQRLARRDPGSLFVRDWLIQRLAGGSAG